MRLSLFGFVLLVGVLVNGNVLGQSGEKKSDDSTNHWVAGDGVGFTEALARNLDTAKGVWVLDSVTIGSAETSQPQSQMLEVEKDGFSVLGNGNTIVYQFSGFNRMPDRLTANRLTENRKVDLESPAYDLFVSKDRLELRFKAKVLTVGVDPSKEDWQPTRLIWKRPPGVKDTSVRLRKLELMNVGLHYHEFFDVNGRSPTGLDEFLSYSPTGLYALNKPRDLSKFAEKVRNHQIKVVWNAGLLDEPGKSDRYLLAYETSASESGGVVLMGGGSVKSVTADEFEFLGELPTSKDRDASEANSDETSPDQSE